MIIIVHVDKQASFKSNTTNRSYKIPFNTCLRAENSQVAIAENGENFLETTAFIISQSK